MPDEVSCQESLPGRVRLDLVVLVFFVDRNGPEGVVSAGEPEGGQGLLVLTARSRGADMCADLHGVALGFTRLVAIGPLPSCA